MLKFMETCSLPLAVVFLVVGFVLLIKGADSFVEGSSGIARRFHVPAIIIGLTIVAMGTSLPETAVSVTASVSGNNALAVSNAVGSNIFNLMMVIGVCALLTPVAVKKETVWRDIPFSVLCAILLLVLGYLGGMTLGHLDGVILIVLFAGFIIFMVSKALAAGKAGNTADAESETEGGKDLSVALCLLYIVLGGAGIALGGDVVVKSASNIAMSFGMSQTLVGLTIVSVGTSLPELVTSIVAARKNEIDMALGNAIGSNIFNILMVLGIASAISPIAFLMENIIDIVVLLAFSLLVWLFAATKKRIGRLEGLLMVALYAGYIVYACIR